MSISIRDVRQRLAKIGIELRSIRRQSDRPNSQVYEIASPVGTTKLVGAQELAGLLRDVTWVRSISA